MFRISLGWKPGQKMTVAQKTSSLFAEEPIVLGKVLRRQHPPRIIDDATFEKNMVQLLRQLKAGAIKIEVQRPVGMGDDGQPKVDWIQLNPDESLSNLYIMEELVKPDDPEVIRKAQEEADRKAKEEEQRLEEEAKKKAAENQVNTEAEIKVIELASPDDAPLGISDIQAAYDACPPNSILHLSGTFKADPADPMNAFVSRDGVLVNIDHVKWLETKTEEVITKEVMTEDGPKQEERVVQTISPAEIGNVADVLGGDEPPGVPPASELNAPPAEPGRRRGKGKNQ